MGNKTKKSLLRFFSKLLPTDGREHNEHLTGLIYAQIITHLSAIFNILFRKSF